MSVHPLHAAPYRPQTLSGPMQRATQWTLQNAGAQRLWNLQAAYNAACISGPCHAALSGKRLSAAVRSAATRQQGASGVWGTFTTTVAYDVRRGAHMASRAARPATLLADGLVGTGRSLEARGTPEDRVLRTVDGLGTHFTHSGVLGAVLLGTMLASAVVGAAVGAFYGVGKGACSFPTAWVLDRKTLPACVWRGIARGALTGASQAVMADILLMWVQVQAVRLGTAGLKLGVAALGALAGLAVGLPHGLAAAYSVGALRPQLQADAA